ncbi:hypothetical protein [Nocardia sp. NBC_00511]|uniref:hypothetical protein n=1 Tax=Nocardia sp. NBC_00511 TaxID=2903591 RepID=UPI0030DE956A
MSDNPALHQMPERPVLDLEVARRALERHAGCGDECEAGRYFAALVPQLRRGTVAWNIWAPIPKSGSDSSESSGPEQ